VLKTSAAGDLRAVKQLAAAENRGFVSGDGPDALAKAIAGEQGAGAPVPGGLTSRQKEVLRLLSQGMSARAAGEVLGISQRTVEYHKNQMMQLAGVTTTTALVMWGGAHRHHAAGRPRQALAACPGRQSAGTKRIPANKFSKASRSSALV